MRRVHSGKEGLSQVRFLLLKSVFTWLDIIFVYALHVACFCYFLIIISNVLQSIGNSAWPVGLQTVVYCVPFDINEYTNAVDDLCTLYPCLRPASRTSRMLGQKYMATRQVIRTNTRSTLTANPCLSLAWLGSVVLAPGCAAAVPFCGPSSFVRKTDQGNTRACSPFTLFISCLCISSLILAARVPRNEHHEICALSIAAQRQPTSHLRDTRHFE